MTITINMSDADKTEMIHFLIKKMYAEPNFYVCSVTSIFGLAGINIHDLEIYNLLLRPLHCAKWEDIPETLKAKIDACVSPWVEKPKIVELHEEYDILHLV